MYTFPKISECKLENGLMVLLAPDHEQQGLTIGLQIPVGEFSDSVSCEGTAELTVGLMQKGTSSMSSEEFANKLEQTGTSFFAETGDEHLVLGCKMLSRHAKTIMPIFWEMLCSPRFDGKELTRIKREMVTALMAEYSDPHVLANKHFFPLLCGKEHPAGRVHTIKSIQRINLETIRSFYDAYFQPAGSFLVIAGAFDLEDFHDGWSSLCLGWKNRKGLRPVVAPALTPLSESATRIINKKDVTQASLIIGHPVPGELAPDRNALALANYILGGGNFSSRLMERIRTDKGKTYSIHSQMMCNRECGIFMISTSTLSSQTAEVIRTILDVYREFSKNGVTDEELRKAKEFAVGNMAFQLEGIGNIAEKLLWLRLYGRENAYIERFDEVILSLSKNAVNEAIRASLSSEYFSMVVVAREEDVRSQLMGFGKVSTMHFRAAP
jgi:zinc protease